MCREIRIQMSITYEMKIIVEVYEIYQTRIIKVILNGVNIAKILEQKFEIIHISKFKLKRHVLSSSKSI